jgi:poly-gamma-glutamate synthesis protein (capsule biosynthesis protein)
VLQTANNHCFDRGVIGMMRTLDAIEGRGMRAVGTARSIEALWAAPLLVTVKGLDLAFRAYTIPPNVQVDSLGRRIQPRDLPVFVLPFNHWRDQNRMRGLALFRDHVAQARSAGAEFLVALVHWGKEYYARPTADQRDAAHDLVDAGFDLVVGTHSHVLNGAEVYRGKLIAYSLGNLMSQGRMIESRTSAVLEVRVVPGSRTKPAAVAGFGYWLVFLRHPDHLVEPLDSATGPVEAQAWAFARQVLGSSIVR